MDWCQAASLDLDQVTGAQVQRFQHEVNVSARCLADVWATARERGVAPAAPEVVDPWAVVETQFDDLDVCLHDCACQGWPAGYRGRRDAWLLVLTRGLRLSRREALEVTSSDLGSGWTVAGRQLTVTEDPGTCPRCIAARWLECRKAEYDWGRTMVRQVLSRRVSLTVHACEHTDLAPCGVPQWLTLAPALDQHGWISSGYRGLRQNDQDDALVQRAMTPRTLTSVLTTRCLSAVRVATTGQEEMTIGSASPTDENHAADQGQDQPSFDATTLDRFEAACDRADKVNARVAALLAAVAPSGLRSRREDAANDPV